MNQSTKKKAASSFLHFVFSSIFFERVDRMVVTFSSAITFVFVRFSHWDGVCFRAFGQRLTGSCQTKLLYARLTWAAAAGVWTGLTFIRNYLTFALSLHSVGSTTLRPAGWIWPLTVNLSPCSYYNRVISHQFETGISLFPLFFVLQFRKLVTKMFVSRIKKDTFVLLWYLSPPVRGSFYNIHSRIGYGGDQFYLAALFSVGLFVNLLVLLVSYYTWSSLLNKTIRW